jgi:hypothetical protein
MKAQKFNDRHRYTLDADEHKRDCDCGECLDFIAFSKRLLYGKGITTRGIVHGQNIENIEITTRGGR